MTITNKPKYTEKPSQLANLRDGACMDRVSNKWASLALEPEPGQPTSSSSSSWMRCEMQIWVISVCLQHANFDLFTHSPPNVSGVTLVSMRMCMFSHPQTHPPIKTCMWGADDHWDEKTHAWTLPCNSELLEVRVENVHLDIWNKQLHQSFSMSRVSLNNLVFIEYPELCRHTVHFYGSLRGKSPSQGSVMGDKVSEWITQFHRAHSRRDANGMSLTGIERRLTSHAGWHCFI